MSLMKVCKCQNLNTLFCEINFLELPKYSWNLQMLSIIENFKNWKNFWKKNWESDTPFGRKVEKLTRLLARWYTKLKNWHVFGMLARKN